VQLNDAQAAAASLKELQQIQGLFEKLAPLHITAKSHPEVAVSAAEFLLEGMTAHKRISRSEERAFTAAEKKQRNMDASQYAERIREREFEASPKNRSRRGFN
jgi:magnesium chelatase subunit I